jgi:hypothetical protein
MLMVRDFLLLRPEDEDSAMSLDFRRALDLKRCRNTVDAPGKRRTRARPGSREVISLFRSAGPMIARCRRFSMATLCLQPSLTRERERQPKSERPAGTPP